MFEASISRRSGFSKLTFGILALFFLNFSLKAQTPETSARNYLSSVANQFGLKPNDIADIVVSAEHTSDVSKTQHIYFTQRYQGIDVFNSYSSIHIKDNKVVHANNAFFVNLDASVVSKGGQPGLGNLEIVEKVATLMNYNLIGSLSIVKAIGGDDHEAIVSKNNISLVDIPTRLIYFPQTNPKAGSSSTNTEPQNNMILAWEMYIYEPNQNNYWYIIADASTAKILYRNNLVLNCFAEGSDHQTHKTSHTSNFINSVSKYKEVPFYASTAMVVGQYNVYPMPVESPNYGVRAQVFNPDNALASPFGWHDTNGAAGAEYTITRGNNTHAYEDGNNPGFSPDGTASLVFDFPINTVYIMGTQESEPAIITNLFYWTNIVHDVIYQYGFTEAAGNFQVNNYGKGGVGNDDVRAEAQDGSGTCNANFGTPPDGNRPTMQMYVCGSRDGDIDNGVIVHEYGHGISNRLVGGPANVNCLNNAEQMGEGWSDWYALMLSIEPGDQGTDSRGIGTWLFGQGPNGGGIRAYPYSTNMAINPHTYNSIKTAAIPHGVGSVWCAMLWEVTWSLITKYGYDPNFYTGIGGNNRALRIVTEALKLTACSPGFVDGRAAIIQADKNLYNGADTCDIWKAFAKRGLGLGASQGSSSSVTDGTEAFNFPVACNLLPNQVCFDYTGAMQTYTVPAGVTSVTIDVYGAEGGTTLASQNNCGGSPDKGGLGGYAKGTLAVTPGEVLNIFVGQKGLTGPGSAFNGGGPGGADAQTCSSGGGGSDVRQGGTALANRKIVAGGGGGAEYSCGGLGGGAGGGTVGGDASGGDCNASGADGKGGTQAAGGAAGIFNNCGSPAQSGTAGSLGQGGSGAATQHSAGGGGGYYGGGGGATDGSAGGGSSYIGGVTNGTTTAAQRVGNGQVCITPAVAALSITCPAALTVECANLVPPANTALPVVSGTCTPLTVTFVSDVISNQTCTNRFLVTRTYRVTDACSTSVTCTQQITVNDITGPSIVGPANVTVACNASVPAPDLNAITLADVCGNVGLVKTHVGDVITNRICINKYTISRTYRGTDVCGNFKDYVQTITVNDATGPTVSCKNITIDLPSNGIKTITGSDIVTSVTDNCTASGLITYTLSQSTFTCADVGVRNVTVSALDECSNAGTCTATVTVRDVTPPDFMPACPKGNLISLSAGPGECGAYWDAPQFMAIDNCPAGDFFGAQSRSVGCTPTPQFASVSGGTWGYLFDITNTSPNPLNIQGFETWFHSLNTGITTGLVNPNGQYEYWFRNTSNTSWKAGWVGTITNAGGCLFGTGTNMSPKTLWTLGATTPANSGIRVFGWQNAANAASIDTFDVTTGGKLYDTIRCPDKISIDSSRKGGGLLTLAPGETRGIFLGSKPGTQDAFILGPFGSCSSLAGYGDANLKMNMAAVSPNGIIIDYAAGANIGGTGFQCAAWGYPGNILYATTTNMIRPVQYCGAPYGPGCFFPIGCTKLCYRATDASGNSTTCEFDVCVKAFANPTRALACLDDIQISLDDSCFATINADMALSGGPYSCYDDYIVRVNDWITNAVIDVLPNRKGIQIGRNQIGRSLKITITDPVTGNSCWSHATVEDKIAPKMTCLPDLTVSCVANVSPAGTGTPSVYENCGSYSLTYTDSETQGSCALGFDRIIVRKWVAIDDYNNRSECIQKITVRLGDVFDVKVPLHYDGLPGNQPMLMCDEKINRTKDYTPHMTPSNECVDGYLLDSTIWYARTGFPNIYSSPFDGGASGRRVPRALGWNCIDDPADANFGHPSPDPVYYPAHPDWSQTNPRCWGPNTHIMWIGTGRPTANCRNFGVTYKDVIIDLAKPGCDAGPIGCYKVLRQWTVLDWCTGTLGGHNQVIKVADVTGPEVLYPDTVIVNMDVWKCEGTWDVPKPWLTDNCSNEVHYTVEILDGVVSGNETDGYVISEIPRGVQDAYIIAEDCCGNITKKRVAVSVSDNTPPVAVCDKTTVVSINGLQSAGSNVTKIYAESFDDGSFDNCSPHVFFKVIRMEELISTPNGRTPPYDNRVSCDGLNGDDDPDPILAPGNQVYFDDFVKFCCNDVGKTIMVVLRVFDVDPGAGPVHPNRFTQAALRGHYSDCMVEVEVQDKSAPSVIAPPDIVVSCMFWFDYDKLTDPNNATFGRVVTNIADRHKVVTTDIVCAKYCVRNDLYGYPPYNPTAPINNQPAQNKACNYYKQLFDTAHWDRKYDLTWGFDGYAVGACSVAPRISVSDLRECGQGRILRNISVQGPTGARQSVTQTIHIVDCDPFYIDPVACDDKDDIQWPDCGHQGTIIEGCGADVSPDNPALGRPIVLNGADDNCALISIEYKDEVFTIEPDACFKVIRTWIVIDWCQYEPFRNPNQGRWEHTQVIKVRDRQRPVVTCEVGDCEPAVKDPVTNICWGHISLTAGATDNCTPLDWLKWEYKIDLYNNGTIDYNVGSLTHKEYAQGNRPINKNNPYADDNTNPFDASGRYPIGVHKVKWFVEDGCGNVGTCEKEFEIKDCKAPTPYCHVGTVTTVMPSTGCITIWAKDFDAGSYDNCTNPGNLHFYIDGIGDSLTICCSDFVDKKVNDELVIPITMCVEDEEGNHDCCITTLVVQDSQDSCDDVGSVKGKITGELKTEKGDATSEAEVDLMKNGLLEKQMKTVADGKYSFYSLEMYKDYEIRPIRNDDPLNGVTTADIVKIQRHILGQEVLSSPYKLIAADVNQSKSITASDISEIRKLILGQLTKFTKSDSWVFVPEDFNFSNPNSPWPYPSSKSLQMATENNNINFVAVKMGDVNGNSKAHFGTGTQGRTNGKLNLEVDQLDMKAGEEYVINIKSSNFKQIAGYQFTLKLDVNAIQFVSVINNGVLNTTDANFGTQSSDKGIITTSWNSDKELNLAKNDILFSVKIRAIRNASIGSVMTITSDLTKAEAYNLNIDTKEVELSVRTENGPVSSSVFELYQNTPNPMAKYTDINFRLPEANIVKLSLYDLTGKVLRVYEVNGQKGLNTIHLKREDINATGVIYYQLDAADHTATRRMLLTE